MTITTREQYWHVYHGLGPVLGERYFELFADRATRDGRLPASEQAYAQAATAALADLLWLTAPAGNA